MLLGKALSRKEIRERPYSNFQSSPRREPHHEVELALQRLSLGLGQRSTEWGAKFSGHASPSIWELAASDPVGVAERPSAFNNKWMSIAAEVHEKMSEISLTNSLTLASVLLTRRDPVRYDKLTTTPEESFRRRYSSLLRWAYAWLRTLPRP